MWMQVGKYMDNRLRNSGSIFLSELFQPCQLIYKFPTFQQFHDYVVAFFIFETIENFQNVWVIKWGQNADFIREIFL